MKVVSKSRLVLLLIASSFQVFFASQSRASESSCGDLFHGVFGSVQRLNRTLPAIEVKNGALTESQVRELVQYLKKRRSSLDDGDVVRVQKPEDFNDMLKTTDSNQLITRNGAFERKLLASAAPGKSAVTIIVYDLQGQPYSVDPVIESSNASHLADDIQTALWQTLLKSRQLIKNDLISSIEIAYTRPQPAVDVRKASGRRIIRRGEISPIEIRLAQAMKSKLSTGVRVKLRAILVNGVNYTMTYKIGD